MVTCVNKIYLHKQTIFKNTHYFLIILDIIFDTEIVIYLYLLRHYFLIKDLVKYLKWRRQMFEGGEESNIIYNMKWFFQGVNCSFFINFLILEIFLLRHWAKGTTSVVTDSGITTD